MRWFNMRGWASITIGAPYLWLLVLFLIPFIIVVAMSFALRTPTSPPFSYGRDGSFLSLTNYARLFQDDLYIRAFLTSLKNAGFATLLLPSRAQKRGAVKRPTAIRSSRPDRNPVRPESHDQKW